MKRLVCILMCLSLLMSMFLTAAAEDAATVKEIPDDILAMIGPYEEEVTICKKTDRYAQLHSCNS